jgi:voltage-gated potassium channel
VTRTHRTQGSRRLTWIVVATAVLRVVVAAAAEVTVFYLLPLSPGHHASPFAVGAMAIGALIVILGLQVAAIAHSPLPAVRAVEALAASIPLLLLTFAAAYYMLSSAATTNFTQPVGRTDAVYFATTVLSTVGFGDIAPVSQTARLVVTTQMLIDLLFIAAGLKVIVGAVKLGRERRARGDPDGDQRPDESRTEGTDSR